MSFKRQLLMWTGIGLSVRLILMPFTMHGQDLTFINYFPMMWVKEGIWDVYGFMSTKFAFSGNTYYGPVLFFIMAAANFVFVNVFNASSLVKLLETSSTMMFGSLTTVDYVRAFSNLDLFKNLFLMKSPYLIFDFLIAAILLKLALSKKLALASYKLWMLNIVILHSTYAIGQTAVITALFVIAALYAALKKRPYLAVLSLSLGGATKIFPYILILPVAMLLGNNWKEKLRILFAAAAFSILPYLPFYLSSGTTVLAFFTSLQKPMYAGKYTMSIIAGTFIVLYTLICYACKKDSRLSNPESKTLYYFAMIMFLGYTTGLVRLRYLSYVTPVLALLIPRYKKFAIYALFVILVSAFLNLHNKYLQLGLFAPIDPEYFMGLPTIHEIIGRFADVEMIYKILCRVSFLSYFVGIWWIWRIKLNNENIVFSHRK